MAKEIKKEDLFIVDRGERIVSSYQINEIDDEIDFRILNTDSDKEAKERIYNFLKKLKEVIK